MALLPTKISNELEASFTKTGETLTREPITDEKSRVEIEVGDSKQPDFKPQFKVMRWDNEVNFSLRAKEDANATVEVEGDKVKYVASDQIVHFYEKNPVAKTIKPTTFNEVVVVDRGEVTPSQLTAEYELTVEDGVDRALMTTSFVDRETLLMYGQQAAASYYDLKRLKLPIYRFRTDNHSNPMYADQNLGWIMFHVPNASALDMAKVHNDFFDAIETELAAYGVTNFTRNKYKLYIDVNGVQHKIASVAFERDTMIAYVNFGTDYKKSEALYKKGVPSDSLDDEAVEATGIWSVEPTVPKTMLQAVANTFAASFGATVSSGAFNAAEQTLLTKYEAIATNTRWIEQNEREDDLVENIDGQYEIEVELPAKPASNELRFTIQTKGLRFEKQSALTEAEKFAGLHRAINVIDSIAVFHETKKGAEANGMEYGSGKAFHIYRPKIVDAEGNYTWGDLSIDQQTGELVVTIDQQWLNTAIYPIMVDPTFGYTTAGASTRSLSTNNLNVCKFTLSEDGDVDKLTIYSRGTSTYGGTTKIWKATIYSDSSGYPNAYQSPLGAEVGDTTTAAWRDSTFSSAISLTAGTYWIGMHKDSGSNHVWYYDSGSTNQAYYTSNGSITYNSPPSTFPGGASGKADNVSVYATYTATGGGGTTTESITKSLGYSILSTDSVTKSLQYAIETTDSITKSLAYAVTASSSITKSLGYVVTGTLSVTKSLTYTVLSAVSVTKSLSYEVQTTATVQKSLEYVVVANTALTKSLTYAVKTTDSITKGLTYRIEVLANGVTKSLSYVISASQTVTKSLQYAIETTDSVTKSLSYEVTATDSITKSLQYAIVYTASAIQKALQYVIAGGTNIVLNMQYVIETTSSITKSLSYYIETTDAITKSLSYVVTSSQSITKSLAYEVTATQSVTKSLAYEVQSVQSVTKSLQYAILVEGIGITKSMQYAVLVSPADTIQKSLAYEILTTDSITKSLGYAVESAQSITKSMQYAIFTQSQLTLSMEYAIETTGAITKSMNYVVESQTAITKSMRYVIAEVSILITKSMRYELLVYGYTRAEVGYTSVSNYTSL